MDKMDLNEYYDALEDMFGSKGWKFLTEDWTASAEELDTVAGCTTIEQLHERRGRLDVLQSLISLPESIGAIREMNEEADDDDLI